MYNLKIDLCAKPKTKRVVIGPKILKRNGLNLQQVLKRNGLHSCTHTFSSGRKKSLENPNGFEALSLFI